MAVKEILDVLGENPTQAVYNEGKTLLREKLNCISIRRSLKNT